GEGAARQVSLGSGPPAVPGSRRAALAGAGLQRFRMTGGLLGAFVAVATARRDQPPGPEDPGTGKDVARDRLLDLLRDIVRPAEIAYGRDAAVEIQAELLDSPDRRRCIRVAEHREIVAALLAKVHVQVDQAGHHVQPPRVDGA